MISAMEIRWGSGWVGLISTFQSWSWGVKVRGADKTVSWKLGRQCERRIQPQATVPTVVACNSDRTNSTPSGVSMMFPRYSRHASVLGSLFKLYRRLIIEPTGQPLSI